jgi:hypothetical protein
MNDANSPDFVAGAILFAMQTRHRHRRHHAPVGPGGFRLRKDDPVLFNMKSDELCDIDLKRCQEFYAARPVTSFVF